MTETRLRDLRIPFFPDLVPRILPVLVTYWVISTILAIFGYPIALVVGAWATVSTMMLWPVVRGEHNYLSIRSGWIILAVVSMIGIPLFSYIIITSTNGLVKSISLVALAVDIGIWGIPASLRNAFGKPLRMLFRPDLLFGGGRIIAGGIVGIGLGMKFIFTDMPPGNIPVGNWYALFLVIVFGLVQIIPLRGMMKMRNSMSRMFFGRMGSLWVTMARELYLLLGVVGLMFGFSNFFGGVTPFTRNIIAGSWIGLTILVASALFIIIVRSIFKKYVVGDPFILETKRQGIVKHTILAAGLIVFIYGLITFMTGRLQPINSGQNSYLSVIGTGLVIWGVFLLVPIRTWAQNNERAALIAQMTEIVLPNCGDDLRKSTMSKLMIAIARLPKERRVKFVNHMLEALNEMPKQDRSSVIKTQMIILSEFREEDRKAIIEAQDAAMKSST